MDEAPSKSEVGAETIRRNKSQVRKVILKKPPIEVLSNKMLKMLLTLG